VPRTAPAGLSRGRIPPLVASTLASLLAVGALAAPPAGAVVGVVQTTDGLVLPGVGVTLASEATGQQRRVLTGPDGGYRADELPAGDYRAVVDAPGLAIAGPARVTVEGIEVRLDLVLSPAPVAERVVVSATRGEATLSSLGVATSVLDRERIDERAAPSLLPLLQEVPGVATARAGAVGLQASAFVRGGEARFARVLIDGVPVNQPGGAFDFGTAVPLELERVEVVRGAASSLYGSDALAGVVSLETRRAGPDEPPSIRAEGEAGSFSWRRWLGATSGARGRFDWNAGVQRLTTDNPGPNEAFDQTAAALSAGGRLGERTQARVVARIETSSVGTPGPTAYGRPDLDASFDRKDVVLSTSVRRAEAHLVQTLTMGFARTRQLSLDPVDSGSWVPEWQGQQAPGPLYDFSDPAGFQNETSRLSAGYEAEVSLGRRHLLTAGGELEHERGAIGSLSEPLLGPERTNLGAYLQDHLLLGRRAYATIGGRVERNGSYGTRAVPRAALAFRVRDGEDATTLRASVGLGIKEPGFLESFGSPFVKGNPDLRPESSTTYDLGLEQRLLQSRIRLTATAFHHDYRDQIAYSFADGEGTYVNLARTRARGVEVECEARPLPALSVFGAYTYLDGEILQSPSDFDPVYHAGQPLLRRPKHQLSLSARIGSRRFSVGATVVHVGERADSDFVGLGLTRNAPYTRLDGRLRVRLAEELEALVIGENLADARYQEVLGYPAPGLSVRAGVRLSLGGRR
jgi:vitamin B12 transporter